ncbi:hypothetical protein FXV83_16075 [Bradyrhizobium hipponense]|uniref:Uncharacterized protein n=1 Tax=Bradyrhizobium hipponense TaxID=2605638 RepID=A0A5S4YM17_9BRAD|nr:hypothetical protein [Bradyrhizobium hipponense]TYO65451.1 hypothetical protein FXV83_16075 [Bradyrhizobium hipponense]
MFYLVRLDRDENGNLVETPLPDYGTFPKGADAAKASKTAATATGAKVQCRRIAQAGDWRAAMLKRFEDGQLLPLPPKWDLEPIKDHFAHLATIDNSLIGFIESEENGIINKPTVLTPGRYLTRFYPDIDDNRRRHLIAAIDPSGEVYFATSEEDIEWIYRDGPESCMSGKHAADFEDLPAWPSAPYAGGDLAVAYTKNSDGRIQSRALCWPEKKLFGRVYGDFQRMKAALEAEGYTWMRDDNTVHGNKKLQVFVGAKLLKIPTENHEDEYVMPYFDDIKVAIDMGDHFVTAEQGEPGKTWIVSGSSDDGTAVLHTMCPRKNVPAKTTDMIFVLGADEMWSPEAVRYEAFVCRGTGKHWSNDFKVIMGDGRYWSKEHFEQHGEFCTVSGKNWPKAEFVEKDGQRMHKSVAHDNDDDRADAFADLMMRPRPGALSTSDLLLNRHRRVA